MTRFTVMPFLLAIVAGIAAMPTNVYQICAFNVGTLEIEPWRTKASGAVRRMSQGLREWLTLFWTPQRALACLAVLLALLLVSQGAAPETLLLAVGPVGATTVQTLEARRATLLREAEGLRSNGSFADDAARQAFDAKMAEIETIDISLRGQSQYLIQPNPLDPDAPAGASRLRMDSDPPSEPNDHDRGAEIERERINGIMLACRAARLPLAFQDKLMNDKTPLVRAQALVFEELRKRADPNDAPTSTQVRVQFGGDDPLVHERRGIENALLHRVSSTHFKLEDIGRKYRGLTLIETAKVYLNSRGIRTTEMSKNEIAATALGLTQRTGYHTTSDFPLLLADVTGKTLRREYELAPATYTAIGRRITLPDYKPSKRLQLGEAPALLEVKEHGEYTHGTIGEGRETMQLLKYGRKFAITREALINDDTDAFSRVPMKFGRAARNLESNLAWYQILSNPTMGDSIALFHASHGNLAPDNDPIDVDTVGEGRAAMMLQTSRDSDDTTFIASSPKYLIVPPSLATKADQFVNPITAALVADANPFGPRLTVVVEPRLEVGVLGASGSSLAWYLAADPNQVDILEYGYLDGEEGPQIENRVGFDVDGLEIKCRLDFAAKVVDWKGLWKNLGDEES